MDHIEIKQFIKNKQSVGESTAQTMNIIFNESSIIDMKYKVYSAVYENIILTNITTTDNTISYKSIDQLNY